MPKDQRKIFEERKSQLERDLNGLNLTPEQKKLLLAAMEFGYSAAYSSRTCDMHDQFFQGEEYTRKYGEMKRLLE